MYKNTQCLWDFYFAVLRLHLLSLTIQLANVKLIVKDYFSAAKGKLLLFLFCSVITIIFALLAYAVVSYGPALVADGLAYGVSLGLYGSDMLVAASTVPLSASQKQLLEDANNYDANATRNISTVDKLREASNDDTTVLNANVKAETASLEQVHKSLADRLEAAKLENPSRSDDFEGWAHAIKDARDIAISQLKETAEVALDQIDSENSSQAIVLIIGESIVAEAILAPLFMLVSVALQLYSNRTFRHHIKF